MGEEISNKLKINGVGNQGGDKFLHFLRTTEGARSDFAILKGDLLPTQCYYNEDNLLVVKPYGGPTLIPGELVPNNPRYKIENIQYSFDKEMYIVELEILN